MKEFIGLAAAVLALFSSIPYIFDIIRGKTKPHVYTWIIWSIVTVLAFIIQWQSGGGAGSWTTGVTGLLTIMIMILCFKNGTKDVTKSDGVLFIGALLAIPVWYFAKNPTLAIIIVTFIDVVAYIPTMRKTANAPESETLMTHTISAIRHGLSIIALASYSIATVLYPAALVFMNSILVGIIVNPSFAALISGFRKRRLH